MMVCVNYNTVHQRCGRNDLKTERAHGHVCEDGSGGATRQAAEYVRFLPGGDATLYIMGAVFVAIIAIKVASG
jgi:hypothetical protein